MPLNQPIPEELFEVAAAILRWVDGLAPQSATTEQWACQVHETARHRRGRHRCPADRDRLADDLPLPPTSLTGAEGDAVHAAARL
ncbi:hypothetical protein C6P97_31430 [Burkholderia multivorans]|uniref:Uncharacterized protein n=1 Tax=Burkholderia multivorans TaxID=87883 RepID=A0AB37B1D2_9BURK|nr:hypothetical protein C6P97_31430 [Burkholderia multivorans]PRE53067.1 hypothetical protein C6P99_06330 [Burkholderia multivorans]